jgi:hypothetical protein
MVKVQNIFFAVKKETLLTIRRDFKRLLVIFMIAADREHTS